ncbi:golgin subfamily A member 1 [Nematostella vectensis]|uniref:golgin subfamily A member 1 n=1 Tax=Nematostella vectensis TaxID=45351 RepID=UPI0020774F53|nr:golgin subfamily A member 1 [Nematostella vectensis]
MFTKLKQKIEQEGEATPVSPRTARKSKPPPRVNGWTENKWERRRLSNASLYESRESLLSSQSGASSYLSRRGSFTSRSSTATPITPVEPPNSTNDAGRASREEILAMLARKTEQVSKLEVKISDMAGLLKEHSRANEKLKETLEQAKTDHSRKLQDIDDEYEQRIEKMKADHAKALRERSQVIEYQTDSTRKATEILEKSKELEYLDKEYTKQKYVLDELQERLNDLTQERENYETREKTLQSKITSIEKENNSLRDELNKTVSELTQKSLQLSRVEKDLAQTESELNTVRQSYTLLKNKTTAELQDKQTMLESVHERNSDLERRLQDCKLSGNDKYDSLERERQTLEKRLSEARDQLNEARASTNDRINTLNSLVSTLNERLERKESTLMECRRRHDEELTSLQEKIKNLEERLSSTNQLISSTKNDESGRIQALIKRNDQLELELERARQNLNSSSKVADEQISDMESEINRLEETRHQEKAEMELKMAQLKEIENEYSVKADQYKQHIADLEEEKDQLQNELDSQTEELRQVSLCLEDAMKRTYELKSQIAHLQDNLKEKESLLTCYNSSKSDSGPSSYYSSPVDHSDAYDALRGDLDTTRARCKKAEEALLEREKTIMQLRREASDREELLNRSTTKLKQYEENNRFIKNDRIYASDARDSHKVISALRQQIQEMEHEREMLQLDENELRELREERLRHDRELTEKEKKIRLLQSKVTELKKAFQRELKLPVPGEELTGSTPDSPGSDTNSIVADKDRLEYLDMNFKYLKHVILKYMCSDNKQSRQLINVIAHLLRFSPKEQKCVYDAVDWKLPLES